MKQNNNNLITSQNQSLEMVKKEIVIAMAAICEPNLDADLTLELVEKVKGLTDNEKAKAIENGYNGKYGQCFKLTPHTFLFWINSYKEKKPINHGFGLNQLGN